MGIKMEVTFAGMFANECPFCGGNNLAWETVEHNQATMWSVVCRNDDCFAQGPIDLGKSGAISKWNMDEYNPIVKQTYDIPFVSKMDNTWVGIRVRKNNNYGTIIKDYNGFQRLLIIKMDDGTSKPIIMNNVGSDPFPEENAKWEWYWDKTEDKKWYKFNINYSK